MAETVRARAWLYATLTGDLTLAPLIGMRVHHGVAPAGTEEPYIVFQLLSPGNDLAGSSNNRLWAEPLYLVKAIQRGESTAALEPIVNAIDAALHNGDGVAGSGVIYAAWRERPFDLPLLEGGVMYQQLGGEYRLQVRQT